MALAAPPPRSVSIAGLAADAARHSIPLVQLYFLGGDIGTYLLLTAFDLALGLLFIVVSTRERGDVNSVDPRSRSMPLQALSVLIAAAILGAVSCVIALLIVLPVVLMGMEMGFDWRGIVSNPGFVMQIAGMALLAAVRFQVLFNERTSAGPRGPASSLGPVIGDLEGDRRHSLADYAAQVTLIATFTALGYGLLNFGRAGLWALPAIYAATLVFFDARPDLARQILPELWRRGA